MNKPVSIILFFIIFFAPFAFGTVEAWSVLILRSAVLAAFFIFLLSSIKRGALEYRVNALNIFFAAFIFYTAFQMIFRTSILPQATSTALQPVIIYFMLYLVVLNALKEREAAHSVISAVTITGFLVSLLGIAQFVSGADKIYWLRRVYHTNFFGPFVNENHYACYMSMVSLVTLGSIISGIYRWDGSLPGTPLKYRFLRFMENILNKATLFRIFAFSVMTASIFLSRSRSGMVFFLASIGFFILCAAVGRRSKKIVWLVLLGILASYILLNRIGIETAVSRLGSVFRAGEYEGRVTMYLQGLNVFRDHPVFGTGLGTFSNIFPLYQYGMELAFYEHLHNDILQLIIETGAVGFIFISIPLIFFFVKFILRLTGTSDPYKYYMGLSIAASLFYLSLHSLTDFSMRLNAVSSLFVILIAVLASLADGVKDRKLQIAGTSRTVLYIAAVLLFVFSALVVSKPFVVSILCEKSPTARSFQLAMKIDPKNDSVYYEYCSFILGKLRKKEIAPREAYDTAAKALDRAILLNPYKTKYLVRRGYLYFWQHDYTKAFEALGKAVLMEPDNPRINIIYSYVIFWKAVNETDEAERKKLLALGQAYYKRAGVLSKHVHLYKVISDKESYYLLKSLLKDEGIGIE